MKILGIDYGRARVGTALCDTEIGISFPHVVIDRTHNEQILNALQEIILENEVVEVAVGFPLELDGTEGFAAQEVNDLVVRMKERYQIPIFKVDERMTTAMADKVLRDSGVRRWKDRKKDIDAMAASIILQTYMDLRAKNGPGSFFDEQEDL